MPSMKGRDLLLKVGNGGTPEVFTTVGAARTLSMTIDNRAVDVTAMDAGGLQALNAQAGLQGMQVVLQGLFKDSASEEMLRAAAFSRAVGNYELVFPNADKYAAAFVVENYTRSGAHDGLETFTVTLRRSGGGTFTAGG